MKKLTTIIACIFASTLIASCGSNEPKAGPYNDADSQRDRAKEAQREMSRGRSY